MGLDQENIIDNTETLKILEEYRDPISYSNASQKFASSEPDTTLSVTDELDRQFDDLFEDQELRDRAKDICWAMFLAGYQIGKTTHSYKIEKALI